MIKYYKVRLRWDDSSKIYVDWEKKEILFNILMKGEVFSDLFLHVWNGTCQSDYDIRVGIRRKTVSYVTLNKTNLWPDKVRDSSYCRSDGNLKIEKTQGTAFSSIAISFTFVQRNREARYNLYCVYNTETIMLLQVYFVSTFAREFRNYTFSWNK